MSTQLDQQPSTKTITETEEDTPILTHIIDRGNDTRSANAIILEARVLGTPITALCGYSWVPSRDPLKYPLCEKCVEMFEFAKDFREG